MIESYNEIAKNWGCCSEMVDVIAPDCSMSQWAVQKTVMELANADYYYTKDEVDSLLKQITAGGVTKEEVEAMISAAIAAKANQADLDALSEQVAQNSRDILDRPTQTEVNNLLSNYYSKLETRGMFANYSKVENTTLVLNAEDIEI